MNKILNSLMSLENIYLENINTFLDCPNARSWCSLPFLEISKQNYYLGNECVIELYRADLQKFPSVEELWPYLILVNFNQEGCNWNDIISDVSTYRGSFEMVNSDEFLKTYNRYSSDISDYVSIDLIGVTDSIFIINEWNDVFALCKTKEFYFAFHYWTTA